MGQPQGHTGLPLVSGPRIDAHVVSTCVSVIRCTFPSERVRALAERRKCWAICHRPRYLCNAYDDAPGSLSMTKVSYMVTFAVTQDATRCRPRMNTVSAPSGCCAG